MVRWAADPTYQPKLSEMSKLLFQALRARLRSDRPYGTEPFSSGINLPSISYLRSIHPCSFRVLHFLRALRVMPFSRFRLEKGIPAKKVCNQVLASIIRFFKVA